MLHIATDDLMVAQDQGSKSALPHLTKNEQMVYDKLRTYSGAVGAYELLDALRSSGVKAIPTIYRALYSLETKGLVQHITSTKRYLARKMPNHDRDGTLLLVCTNCNNVEQAGNDFIMDAVQENASKFGFSVRAKHLELVGRCEVCKNENSHEND